jgi:hypothetical protein
MEVFPLTNNMATIRKTLEDTLVRHGLWPEEATKIMDEVQESDIQESMRGRWSDDVSGYPQHLITVLWVSVKHQAVEHLKTNKPKHFALAILTA